MEKNNILTLRKEVYNNYNNITSILALKNNKIVLEEYFNGFNCEDTIHIASVTKSIISILIGISISKGYIENVDQKVLDFFPNYTKKRGEKTIDNITIKHLLTMTAPYKYKYEPYTKVYSSDDWTKSALDLLGGRKGITGEFKYSTIGTQILSGIIANSTKQSVLSFAANNLFAPLKVTIPNNISLKNKEEHLKFITDSHLNGWVTDPKGINTAGWGLTLKSVDMLKIGELYLNDGIYESKQIVPKGWIDESTKIHSKWNDLSYGYLWWIIDEEKHIYAAIGDGGNIIYINKCKNIVVSITSKFKPRVKDRISLINNYIEPMI